MICDKVLGVDSLRPSKLKIHLESNHLQHKDKDVTYFQRLADRIKCWRLDADGVVHAQDAAGIEASFRISLEIAKHKKPQYCRRAHFTMHEDHERFDTWSRKCK